MNPKFSAKLESMGYLKDGPHGGHRKDMKEGGYTKITFYPKSKEWVIAFFAPNGSAYAHLYPSFKKLLESEDMKSH